MTLALDQWITNCEGVKLHVYKDSHGIDTIGVGHNLADGIPLNIAYALRDADIASARHEVMAALPWLQCASQSRQDAITHLCFWVGIASLLGFKKMLAAVQCADWQTAHDELINSSLHNDIPERCEQIANRLLTGFTP